MRTDLVAQSFNRQNCFHGILTGHEVFRLQLFTSARRETHAKVRQSFIPWAKYTHLFRTVLGGKFRNWVQILGSTFRPEEFRGCVKRVPLFNTAFDPNFTDALVLPVGKKADAVPAGLDSIKVVLDFTERQAFIHVLPHHEGWLNIEGDLCDYT